MNHCTNARPHFAATKQLEISDCIICITHTCSFCIFGWCSVKMKLLQTLETVHFFASAFQSKKNKNTQSCASPLTRYFACKWFILNHKRYNTGPNSVQQYISVSVCAALCYLDHVQPLAEEKKKLNNIYAAGFLLLYSSHNEVEHVAPARRSALHVWPRIDFKTRFIHRSPNGLGTELHFWSADMLWTSQTSHWEAAFVLWAPHLWN